MKNGYTKKALQHMLQTSQSCDLEGMVFKVQPSFFLYSFVGYIRNFTQNPHPILMRYNMGRPFPRTLFHLFTWVVNFPVESKSICSVSLQRSI